MAQGGATQNQAQKGTLNVKKVGGFTGGASKGLNENQSNPQIQHLQKRPMSSGPPAESQSFDARNGGNKMIPPTAVKSATNQAATAGDTSGKQFSFVNDNNGRREQKLPPGSTNQNIN